jgi:hypothetical protein
VELEPHNVAALTDLMKYYKQAPRFLGGSARKAEEISNRLEKLNGKNAHSFINNDVTSSTQNS